MKSVLNGDVPVTSLRRMFGGNLWICLVGVCRIMGDRGCMERYDIVGMKADLLRK